MAQDPEARKESFTHEELKHGKPLTSRETIQVVAECYCPTGHSLIDEKAAFGDFNGITVKLRNGRQDGRLSLSPIIGDLSRTFFDFERIEGEIVEICCPTCGTPLPIYDQCTCDAYLVALFTTRTQDFANCIGICQRIGCLNSKIISNFNLRKYSRRSYF